VNGYRSDPPELVVTDAVRLTRRGYSLHAEVAPGTYSLALARDVFAAITESLRQEPCWGVLLDARALTGHLSIADRFFLAVHVARLHLHTPLAVIAPTVLLDPSRFAVAVAHARGVLVEAFTEEEPAVEWLARHTPRHPGGHA